MCIYECVYLYACLCACQHLHACVCVSKRISVCVGERVRMEVHSMDLDRPLKKEERRKGREMEEEVLQAL